MNARNYLAGAIITLLISGGLILLVRHEANQTPVIESDLRTSESNNEPGRGNIQNSSLYLDQKNSKISEKIKIPAKYALSPESLVPLVDSWDSLVNDLSEEERNIAEKLRSSYPEAYQFSSAEQLQWMIENGYPMPEEYLLARELGQEKLVELAKTGNQKAVMLAYDLILDEFSRNADDNDNFLEGVKLVTLENLARRSNCSPFLLHEKARRYSISSERTPSVKLDALEHVAAMYDVAASMGDWRAKAMAQEIARGLEWNSARTLQYAERIQAIQKYTPKDCIFSQLPPP